jgi:riboflavin kinase/FMN adenylyltransferase
MKIFKGKFNEFNNLEPLTITIGNFDGVHVGHQALIAETKKYQDTKSAILTFHPHPLIVLRDVSYQQLTSLEQKLKLLKQTAVEFCFVVEFNQQFANLSPLEFIEFLEKNNVKRVVIGNDFRFGAYAKGTVANLKEHFEVVIVEDILKNQIRISTTYVKDLLYSGNLELAKELLKKDYEIEGVVIHGDKVGRTLGMPTANLDVNNYLLPKNGVYYVTVEYANKTYGGAFNIGYNPTINYSPTKRAEVHILDFNGQLYGEKLGIKFKKFLRPELKFKSKAELVKALEHDILTCKRLFKTEIES